MLFQQNSTPSKIYKSLILVVVGYPIQYHCHIHFRTCWLSDTMSNTLSYLSTIWYRQHIFIYHILVFISISQYHATFLLSRNSEMEKGSNNRQASHFISFISFNDKKSNFIVESFF